MIVSSMAQAIGLLEESPCTSWSITSALLDGEGLPWMPLWVDRFLGSRWVDAMSNEQQLFYFRLLLTSWAMPQPCFLPNDMNLLANWARCFDGQLGMSRHPIVIERFKQTEDGKFLFNERLFTEYVRCLAEYRSKKSRAKKANDARWGKSKSLKTSSRIPNGVLHESQTEIETIKPKIKSSCLPSITPQMVEMIRLAHPRGTESRPSSEKAIEKAVQREIDTFGSPQEAAKYLFGRASRYAELTAVWPEDEKHFVKMCGPWFNDERYKQPDSAWQKGGKNGAGDTARKRQQQSVDSIRQAIERRRARRAPGDGVAGDEDSLAEGTHA